MNAIFGVGLLAAAALLFAWAYGQFLRPQPKAWAQSEFSAVAITLTMVAMFAFALAFLSAFLFNLNTETRWLEIIAVAGGALLLCFLLMPRLMAPALRAADEQSALRSPSTDALPEPANDPHPTSPARPGPPAGKPGKHRAA